VIKPSLITCMLPVPVLWVSATPGAAGTVPVVLDLVPLLPVLTAVPFVLVLVELVLVALEPAMVKDWRRDVPAL